MEIMDAIRGRRSIRKFKNEPISCDVIKDILDAANWAPSGRNEQQWEYLVVGGHTKAKLAQVYHRLTEENMPPVSERNPRQQYFADWAESLGGAPVVIVAMCRREVVPGLYKMVLESVAASFQNLLLAAYAKGLGTCWMTGPLRAEDELKEILNITGLYEIVAMTPLGIPDETPEPPVRSDPELKTKVKWIECDPN
jgi:nitroreductase